MASLCLRSVTYYVLDAILSAGMSLSTSQIVQIITSRCSRYSVQTITSAITTAARLGFIADCQGKWCATLKGVSQPEFVDLIPKFVGCPSLTGNTFNLTFSDDLALQNPLRGWMVLQTTDESFPHMIEFRYFSWSEILVSGAPYVYNWLGVDSFLATAASRRHHAVIRVVMDFPGDPGYAPPPFLGAPCTPYSELGGGCLTDYSWPALVAAAQDTMVQLRARYDGDVRLASVQVGFLGFYGEWYAVIGGSNVFPGPVVQQPYLTQFSQWTSTPVTISVPSLAQGLGAQMATNTIGLQDDAYGRDTDTITVPLMASTGTTDTWRTWLRSGELAYPQQDYWFDTDAGLSTYLSDLTVFHPAFLLNDASLSYIGAARERALRAASSTGYLYWISSVTFSPCELLIVFQNSGSAPFYYDCSLQCSVNDGPFKTVADVSLILPFIPLEITVPTGVQPVKISMRLVSSRVLPGQILYLMNSTVDPQTGILTIAKAEDKLTVYCGCLD